MVRPFPNITSSATVTVPHLAYIACECSIRPLYIATYVNHVAYI